MSGSTNEGTRHPMFVAVKTALLLHVPFFASLLLDIMDVRIGKFDHLFPQGNATMATDGKTIYIDEDFLSGLKLENAVFGVCHEEVLVDVDRLAVCRHSRIPLREQMVELADPHIHDIK